MNKTKIEKAKKRLFEFHGDTVRLVESTLIKSNIKCLIIDRDYGDWWVLIGNAYKTKHPDRARAELSKSKITPIAEVKKKLKQVHGDTVVIREETYKGTTQRAIFVDKDLNKEWPAFVFSVLSGTEHPDKGLIKMGLSHKVTLEEAMERVKKVHGNNVRIKEETYVDATTTCFFINKDGKEWSALPGNIFRGAGHPDNANEKRKETVSGIYGFDNVGQVPELKEKMKETNLGRYGSECSLGSPKVKEKAQNTMKAKHGVLYAAQNPEILDIIVKKQRNTYIRSHWKTGKELICQASWEAKAVDYFNTNQIDFDWQSKTFTMPNGKTYRPDAFLPERGIWIEIKGLMRPKNKEKWDWFKSIYPTAELWDKKKLKEIGIL